MPRFSQADLMMLEALNELEHDWGAVRVDWRDKARDAFEEEFLAEMMPAVRTAATAVAELTLLMKRVVRECS